MRKTVLWQTYHVRVSLSALLALLVVVALAGCGGGGSGSSNNGGSNNGGTPPDQNPTLPFVNGRIVDNSTPAKGVVNAVVSLYGPGLTTLTKTVTSSDGSFTFSNVPTGYTAFSVTSPDTNKWYNFATYLSKQYDTINCKLPLPTLVAGANNLPGAVVMSAAGANPPPPPNTSGCP